MEATKDKPLSPFMTSEQSDGVRKVAQLLRTPAAFIADSFGASPERIEKLLRRRGQWDDMLSIRENVEAHYGARAVEAIEKAI